MFNYLVIAKNRAQFKIQEEGGTTLYRLREFLTLLKRHYPEVIFRKFKGRPIGEDFVDLDFVFIVPRRPGSAMLGQLIEGHSLTLFDYLEPTAKVSIPRQELRIELAGRAKGSARPGLILNRSFETSIMG